MAARDRYFSNHLSRIKSGSATTGNLDRIPDWLMENTYVRGEPYTFLGHEFQERILRDPSPEKVTRKCSQIGLSETSARAALGMCSVMEGFTVIYTLPTATFAKSFTTTRIDPVIEASPALSQALHKTTDNSEVKRLNNSFLFIKGTYGVNAAISIPADAIINDELDFSDLSVVSNYTSRLTHSKYKLVWKFSTPTVGKYGISAAFDKSRQHWNLCKCNHCNHWFKPSYFEHVRLPTYRGDIKQITAVNLYQHDPKTARLFCPKCGRIPSLLPEHRQWVVENNDEPFDVAGYQIQPFDAPTIITPGDLIKASVKYKRYADFINFSLGLPADDDLSCLNEMELKSLFISGVTPGFTHYVLGMDLGLICHLMIAGVAPNGQMLVVYTEKVSVGDVRERYQALCIQWKIRLSVWDAYPYTETVIATQKLDTNLYGCVYSERKGLELFQVQEQAANQEKGQVAVRQVNANRNKVLDTVMGEMRGRDILFLEDANTQTVQAHLSSMKRIQKMDTEGEFRFVWVKAEDGEDHFHHALVYTWLAARLRTMGSFNFPLPGLVHTFKHTVRDVTVDPRKRSH